MLEARKLCASLVKLSQFDAVSRCFICHICSEKLSNTGSLTKHISARHLALKRYSCNVCGESFRWWNEISRHKKRIHGVNADQLQIHR